MYQSVKSPHQFNPNVLGSQTTRDYNYNSSSCKCTHIRNPCIRVTQHITALGIFARDDSVNVLQLSKMYFLLCTLAGDRIDLGSFLACELYSVATSAKGRIIMEGTIICIARFLGIELEPDDKVHRSKWLDKAAFELMGFCQVKPGRLCWIYPGGSAYACSQHRMNNS